MLLISGVRKFPDRNLSLQSLSPFSQSSSFLSTVQGPLVSTLSIRYLCETVVYTQSLTKYDVVSITYFYCFISDFSFFCLLSHHYRRSDFPFDALEVLYKYLYAINSACLNEFFLFHTTFTPYGIQ